MYFLYMRTYTMLCIYILISDDDEYCKIVHVSIIVLGIYTFGTSLLLWWLYKKFTKCFCANDSEGTYILYMSGT